YTPLVVVIGSAFAYGVLALVWALAVIGVLAKLFFWARPTHWGAVLYVAMGWLSLTLLSSLWPVVPVSAMVLMGVGGMIYTLGAVLFSLDGLRFQNAIWHGFVNVASGCFFAAIALAAFTA
ncbi:MAG: hemolysin III family protein, partial [Octadecabacter sp.]|nr:hemolysin III family protein [Octadecabacter sp.]